MADSVVLSVFAPPLARLLLCGGGGLPAAWGPLHHLQTHKADTYPWDPVIGKASGLPGYLYDDGPRIECWSLPLDPASPWPARMAVVAAWMLEPQIGDSLGGRVFRRTEIEGFEATRLHLFRWDAPYTIRWLSDGSAEFTRDDGRSWCCWPALNLPTLPAHLALHPPEVALLLALYDVPAIRARLEAP